MLLNVHETTIENSLSYISQNPHRARTVPIDASCLCLYGYKP
jgi:hypothetical protein